MLNSRFFIITIFCIYTILLAHLSLLALFVLLIIIFAPALILLGGNIPQSLNFFVVIIVTEIFAVKIWIKALKYVRVLESGITSEIKKNVIWMLVMTIIISLGFFVLYTQNLSETANSHNRIIESNKYAVQNCGIIKDLCVTKEMIAYNADKNFGKKLKNAKNACSDLGMRLPTKEEFDVILSPLTNIKYALELNLTDEEFVYLQRHYVKTLRDYPLISVDGNFLTSSNTGLSKSIL